MSRLSSHGSGAQVFWHVDMIYGAQASINQQQTDHPHATPVLGQISKGQKKNMKALTNIKTLFHRKILCHLHNVHCRIQWTRIVRVFKQGRRHQEELQCSPSYLVWHPPPCPKDTSTPLMSICNNTLNFKQCKLCILRRISKHLLVANKTLNEVCDITRWEYWGNSYRKNGTTYMIRKESDEFRNTWF